MSRVELYERIRRDSRLEGLSIRALAARHHVHRRTVREALASAVPAERKVPVREAPALGPYHELIRRWLSEDATAPRKQRHTAHRVWARLRDECGATVAESTVRAFVAEVRFELENDLSKVMIPQTHSPGEEAEVDFGGFFGVDRRHVVRLVDVLHAVVVLGPVQEARGPEISQNAKVSV